MNCTEKAELKEPAPRPLMCDIKGPAPRPIMCKPDSHPLMCDIKPTKEPEEPLYTQEDITRMIESAKNKNKFGSRSRKSS